jgi:hypothetical protein
MTSWVKGGEDIKDFVTTTLRPYYYEKPDDGGEVVSKFSKNFMSSFMDDP